MEVEKKNVDFEKHENDIVFSKAIKAGKRIYYLDVKKAKNQDLFLAITESKKKIQGSDANTQVTYEKHKIFLYKEDFDKFVSGLEEVIGYIKRENGIGDPAVDVSPDIQTQAEEPKKKFFDKFRF